MGQAVITRFAQQAASDAAGNAVANASAQAANQAGIGNTDAAWWCKLLARAAGVLAGAVAFISGLVNAVTSIVSPVCIVAGLLLMLAAVVVLVFEAPICCTYVQFTKPIAAFAEGRTYIQKAIIYCVMAIICFAMCFGVSTFFGCGLIFATGVIYGLMGIGRKADRQQMMANAAANDVPGGAMGRPDDARVGLIDGEGSVNPEPFVGQQGYPQYPPPSYSNYPK